VTVGQWYEHISSKERIKISFVGQGSVLFRDLESNRGTIEGGMEQATGKPHHLYVVFDPADSAKQCFAYSPASMEYQIQPVSVLAEDYQLIK
jgi:hypothetical protein